VLFVVQTALSHLEYICDANQIPLINKHSNKLIGQHQSALAYKLALKDGIGGHTK